MNITYSPYIQNIHRILQSLPSTSQWVVYTPTVSLAHTLQTHTQLSNMTYKVVSGAHTHQFETALLAFKTKAVQGLIISFEQTLHLSKFDIILEAINKVEVLILDAMYRLHVNSIYYAIELELMVRHIESIQPQSLYTIQGDENFPYAHNYMVPLPLHIMHVPCNLSSILTMVKHKKVLWVTQTQSEANTLSSWFNHYAIQHALIHRRVDEQTKITHLNQLVQAHVKHGIITFDTILPLDIQNIDAVIFTFVPQSVHLLYSLFPYCSHHETQWMCMPWFLAKPYAELTLANHAMIIDVLQHFRLCEDGCTMREAERVLNIDSHQLERIIAFLKGKSLIQKVGLKYVVKQNSDIHAILPRYDAKTTIPLPLVSIFQDGLHENIPEGITFAFKSRKILPVGIYNFSQIPTTLMHETGLVFTSSYRTDNINAWITHHQLDVVLIFAHNLIVDPEVFLQVPVYNYDYLDYRALQRGLNPYQSVLCAKQIVDQLPSLAFLQQQRVGIVLDYYHEGWNAIVLAMKLRLDAPNCCVFPLCLAF